MTRSTGAVRPLRVATYNVHAWRGRDGRRQPERIVEVLESIDADVVALQECELDAAALEALSALSRLDLVAAPTFERGGHPYGNALLSSIPVGPIRRRDLAVTGREPRMAIDCTVGRGCGRLRVVATHLGLRRFERRIQGGLLAAFLGDGAHEPLPTVLLGDLNEWRPLGRSLLGFLPAGFGPSRSPATFPSQRPILALDRIVARPAAALADLARVEHALARVASDHLPLVATVAAPASQPRVDSTNAVPGDRGDPMRRRLRC